MPEEEKSPRVINKSGTLRMDDKVAATRVQRDIAGRRMDRRDHRRGRNGANADQKEFDEITIAVDRVSRTVAGGRRMRFKALVAIGDHKNRVGVGVAKGNDVTTAVGKATAKAKKSLITFNMDGETICHEVQTKKTGANILMKPAAPGTGIIAGGTVRAIVGLTGVKNLISKSLGSTNKVNIAYAVIEGLRQQVPRSEWRSGAKMHTSAEKVETKAEKTDASEAEKAEAKTAKAEVKVEKTKTTAKTETAAEATTEKEDKQ